MSAPHVVITGAGGFVGRNLAEGYASLGCRVTGLDRGFDTAPSHGATGATCITADLRDGVPDEVGTADVVIHGAAVTTDPGALGWTAAAHIEANLRPLLSLVAYVERTRPRALVFLSSSGVFAAADGADRLRDTDRPTARSPYAVAKLAGEHVVETARDSGVAVYTVRLGYLYGPNEVPSDTRRRLSVVAQWLRAARAQQPLVVRHDDPARDWTCVTDLAPALQALVAHAAPDRPVHMASPHVVRDRAMAALVADHVPGATIACRQGDGVVKPPMQPSDLPALQAFPWTTPAHGIARLAAAEVLA